MSLIDTLWYRSSILATPLFPLTLLFGGVASIRKGLFKIGLLKSTKMPVPVVIIGNISVGGAGKTPLTIHLANALSKMGFQPGIVSRGYGGQADQPCLVQSDSDTLIVGDEPVLMARHCPCPIVVGADRVAAAQHLLQLYPTCNVILCDDGLQHYRLQRDIELCVIDTARGFGNGLLLPAGPLREPPRRLKEVSAIVLNGAGPLPHATQSPVFRMKLAGQTFQQLTNPAHQAQADFFTGKRVAAVAGIGNPQRFFDTLQAMGLAPTCHPFPDHHRFSAQDLALPEADIIIMTEKDAVKCCGAKDVRIWTLPVSATIEPDLADFMAEKLRNLHGCKVA
ncbi:tetraacyldisaccharide 4'-kinase [Chitinivorax tropicus]|uniref:Tetraacyldisaccharide 4'-kinase n=1 Tax=Chitinivorax tropicus TaxID=714531 RepID=A0A840MNT4_9PROT|nr:tetraacyldisaccharide 4'-kinase [Chitinivorax tropicus]MBB5018412.1 tetraacyldisaccharide 4'-kinase [Chitinivorax tropicus]